MVLSELMTAGVVTATPDASAVSVAGQMRDNRVGSVVIVDPAGSPVAMVTDRDLTVRVSPLGSTLRPRLAIIPLAR